MTPENVTHAEVRAGDPAPGRTTNLIERTFEEERRRTKMILLFNDERSAMKLVFASLIRCSQRWSRVAMSDIERQQMRLRRGWGSATDKAPRSHTLS